MLVFQSGGSLKKVLKFILIFIMLFSLYNVNAYSTGSYDIDIPSTYEKQNGSDIWQSKSTDKRVTIGIDVFQNDNKLNFEDYNEDTIQKDEYIKELEEKFKSNKENITIKSSDVYFTDLNGHKAIKMDVVTTFNDSNYNSDVYQSQYIVASKNYVYYILISSSDKDSLNSKEVNTMINSFNINDEKATKDVSVARYYLSIALVVTLGIFVFVLTSRKRKHYI